MPSIGAVSDIGLDVGVSASRPAASRAEPAAAGAPEGLVTCAKTARDLVSLTGARFPSVEMVGSAAALFRGRPSWRGEEGPRAQLVISPGAIAVERHDLARLQRAAERAIVRRAAEIDLRAALLV